MGDSMTFSGSFVDSNSNFAVFFEDDGHVAYAYLLDGEDQIVGDVWLYNRGVAPKNPEWSDPDKSPFANPIAYVDVSRSFETIKDISEITVNWFSREGMRSARFFVRDKLFAILEDGVKPGWSLLAGRDGPLAKVLK